MAARRLIRLLSLPTLVTVAALVVVVLSSGGPTLASPDDNYRVSVDSAGNEGNGDSWWPAAISADGRYVAFSSSASNLVPGDANDAKDVFVHDRQTGQTTRVSVDSTGNEANGSSGGPAISADGRYVAFHSVASNLIAGDTNTCWTQQEPGTCSDVFVHDRETGETTRVSVDSAGTQADDRSDWPSLSGDGRHVAFESFAANLIPNDTNEYRDVFIHDRQTGTTELVNLDSAGEQMQGFYGGWYNRAVSFDGRYVAFTGWSPRQIYVRDRQMGTTDVASVSSAGVPGNDSSDNPTISPDGRYVVFESRASNFFPGDSVLCPDDPPLYHSCEDVFVHDRQTGTTQVVSVDSTGAQGNHESQTPAISADGRYVVFDSRASNLVPDDNNGTTDLFVHDRETGETTRVSLDSTGDEPNGASFMPAVSADTRYIAFSSWASDLVPGDTNDTQDIFVRDRGPVSPASTPTVTPTPTPTRTLTPTPTVTPTPPDPVGGVAELPDAAGNSTDEAVATGAGSGSSADWSVTLASVSTVAAVVIVAAAWYARRRWLT